MCRITSRTAGSETDRRRRSASKDLQDLFEFQAQLLDDLLALAYVSLGLITRQTLPRATDSESIVIEQTADLPDDEHILTLVIAAVSAPFYRLQLRKLLLPVTQDMWLDGTQVTDFTYGEIALSWDWR
jgi:hypothetical protein